MVCERDSKGFRLDPGEAHIDDGAIVYFSDTLILYRGNSLADW